MKRISDLERKYVMEALDNEFSNSRKNVFIQRLEKEFADRFQVKYAIAHANGTCTMHSALAALGVLPDEEVIVPALTMSSPALAVLHNGCVPVFADVDLDTFTISPESVRKCITAKTKAIISVSLYGLTPDYDELLEICREKNIALIEDNALCFSGSYHGEVAGGFGSFASYSFQASKHLTAGEGGMLITNDEDLAQKARSFCGLGFNGITGSGSNIKIGDVQSPNFSRHLTMGYNYKMSEVSAAVALAQLQREEELVGRRIAVAKIFDDVVKGCKLLKPQLQLPDYENCYWTYAMVLQTEKPDRDWFRFRDLFLKNGGDGFYAAWKLSYNEPLFQNIIQHNDNVWQIYDANLCGNAEFLQRRLIQLKTNYWILEDAERQAEILRRTIGEF